MLREYFVASVGVLTFISLLMSIVHPKLRSITSFGAGVLAICAVLLPLVDIIGDYNYDLSLDELLGDVDYNATDSAIELAFEEGVAEYISSAYKVEKESVRVYADGFDISTLSAERIYVTLSGEAIRLDYKRIEAEVSDRFTRGGECEVNLEIG